MNCCFVNLRSFILSQYSIELLGDLGSKAFDSENKLHDNVQIALQIINKRNPFATLRIYSINATSGVNPEQKASSLKRRESSICNSIRQNDFYKLPAHTVVYWLNERLLQTINDSNNLGDCFPVKKGINTSANERFIHFIWEVQLSKFQNRWFPIAKGGGYCKWYGMNYFYAEWEFNGLRMKEFNSSLYGGSHWSKNLRNVEYFGQPGITCSKISGRSIGFRIISEKSMFDNASVCVFLENGLSRIGWILNSRVAAYFLRAFNQSLIVEPGYIEKIPIPKRNNPVGIAIAPLAYEIKKLIQCINPLDTKFNPSDKSFQALFSHWANCAVLHSLESLMEYLIFKDYEISSEDQKIIFDETGTPAGFFPLISNYDTLPELSSELPEIPPELMDYLQNCDRLTLSPDKLTDIKRRLRNLYESGSGAKVVDDEDIHTDTSTDDEEDEEESEVAVGAHIPIPTETFLEELSVKLEIHPISVYWLLKEGREQEGWRCIPEEKRFTEDTFTVMILRLLGHRWPKQIEAGEPVPDWADKDGIIPISTGAGEQTLLDRVRDRIATEFPNGNVASIEREFAEIVGTSLEKWLTGAFFKRHISQFKKRPITWQIESTPTTRGKGSRGVRSTPAFSSLVYYHQLDGDLLPKLRTQYIGSLRTRYETELRTLENIPSDERTTDQAGRILQLQNWIEELNAFDQKLSEVATTGFCPNDAKTLKARLRQLAIDDATLCIKVRWLRKLMEVMQPEPLETWKQTAQETKLHPDFDNWIEEALTHLDHHCSAVGTQPPDAANLTNDPTSADLAKLICKEAKSMVKNSLSLACQRWWAKFNETLLAPLRQQIKETTEETKPLKEKWDALGTKPEKSLVDEIKHRQATLKAEIKNLKAELKQRTETGEAIRLTIETWKCPEAETWEPWLSSQPLYDAISSLDGRRNPPKTVAEFVAQESAYMPDLNDGVRVNIAPLQKAGLLAAEVIAKKDVEKAISDRAEWRADERRWCREGKLPQPGWWK